MLKSINSSLRIDHLKWPDPTLVTEAVTRFGTIGASPRRHCVLSLYEHRFAAVKGDSPSTDRFLQLEREVPRVIAPSPELAPLPAESQAPQYACQARVRPAIDLPAHHPLAEACGAFLGRLDIAEVAGGSVELATK